MSASLAAFERPRIGNSNTKKKALLILFLSSNKKSGLSIPTYEFESEAVHSALPQRGGEVNLTLGGIDLNNSGSVVVREDKKLLTVLFPDGRDGRAFTLKVARLQEQLQAERDLRAALEVGLSMSSGHFSGSRGMDSKTRAELEEIAVAEADVARLKQKVAELHHQLNQQRQHHYGSLSDASDRYQHAANQSSQQCHGGLDLSLHTSMLCGCACRDFGTSFLGFEWVFVRKYFQHDFDTTLAVCNHERKQRTEDLLGADLRNVKGQLLTSGSSSRLPSRKLFIEPTNLSDSKIAEASTSLSMDDLCTVDSPSLPSTSRAAEVMDYPRHPSAASSTLVELTTRLDFFKERRSQLMEQLHNLDLNYGSTPQDFMYKPSSPPWN
ncbi:Rho GTPase-activating protein 7 [Sesamum angolense]|uniref:Rho GTPase-activating protein 7 n=1 Tax=Sesamum angolense TaxID=2727404 RepID=A0AAE1XAH2_9LAMI|nr:Rho GTPase-activating protein 7 [Sesamum angolense]